MLLILGFILAIVPNSRLYNLPTATLLFCGGALLFTLPLLCIALNAQAFMWDDFAHRLASVFYLAEYQRVPHPDLPPSFSGFPAYPYGLSLIGAIPAWIKGSFQELSLAYFAYIQLLMFALMLWENIPHANTHKNGLIIRATLLIILTTVANPVLTPKILFSAYNDISMGIALTAAAFAALKLIQEEAKFSPRHALSLGLILSIIIAQKQVGLILMGALGIGIIIYYLRAGTLFAKTTLLNGFISVVIPLFIYILWRYYVAHNLAGGEFSLQPLSNWNTHKWHNILYAYWMHLLEKPQMLLPQLLLIGATVYTYLRRSTVTLTAHMLLFACSVAIIYNMALYFFYISSFSEYEAINAASFDRYNLHISWLCWAALLFATLPAITSWVSRFNRATWAISIAGLALCLSLPLSMAYYTPPRNPPAFADLRAYFADLRPQIPPTAAVLTHIASDNPAQSGYINRVATYELRVNPNQATALPATPVYEDFPVVEELHIISDNPELLLQNVQQSGLPISRVHVWTIK